MPELPDVEIFRRRLDQHGLNRTIQNVRVSAPEMLGDVSSRKLGGRLRGHRLVETRRHGKHLFARIGGDGWLRLHFGMTGDLVPFENSEIPRHTRLQLDFRGSGGLSYVSRRKLGQVGLTGDPVQFRREQGLGPDPLESGLALSDFSGLLSRHRGNLKGVLMNQEVLAGLGNVYTDEILFQAGFHPETRVEDLSPGSIQKIHRIMMRVIDRAVSAGADPGKLPDKFLLPRRSPGSECPICGGEIRRLKVAGRSSYHCPSHQDRLE